MTAPQLPGPHSRPGSGTFTLEGRAAPGLFLVGWLAFLMGAGALTVALLAGFSQSASGVLAIVGLALLSVGLVAGAGSQAIERRRRSIRDEADRVESESDGSPDARDRYAGPSPYLVFAAALPSSLLLAALLGFFARTLGIRAADPAVTLVGLILQTLVYIGLVRLLVVGSGALSWEDMGIGRRPTSALVEDVAFGALAAAPILVITVGVAAVLASFLPLPDSPLPPSGGGTGLLFNLVAAAIVAPVGEELFFRGFATTAWARSMPVRMAILRGAVFFALVHILTVGGSGFADGTGRAAVAFLTRVPVSIALGVVFIRRGSLAAPIALHATFNGALLILSELAVHS